MAGLEDTHSDGLVPCRMAEKLQPLSQEQQWVCGQVLHTEGHFISL